MPSAAADVPPTFKKSRRFQNERSLSNAFVSYIWRNRSIMSLAPQNYIGHVERCGHQHFSSKDEMIEKSLKCSTDEQRKQF
jgi:hypothetical protein